MTPRVASTTILAGALLAVCPHLANAFIWAKATDAAAEGANITLPDWLAYQWATTLFGVAIIGIGIVLAVRSKDTHE